MPSALTINTLLTREALLAVRDEIDALLAAGPTPTSAPPSPMQPALDLDPIAVQLKARLSPTLQRLVRFLVDNYVGKDFIWDDVAQAMGADLGSIKSWHRFVSKPLNRIGQANPSAPWLLKSKWDGSRNHYTLSPEWAEAIRRTW